MLFAGRRGGTVRFGILKGLSMAEQAKTVVVALKKSLTEKSSPPRRPLGCVCYCALLYRPNHTVFYANVGISWGKSVIPPVTLSFHQQGRYSPA